MERAASQMGFPPRAEGLAGCVEEDSRADVMSEAVIWVCPPNSLFYSFRGVQAEVG